MNLDNLKTKKVLILGLGREGRDNLVFLRKFFPKKIIGVGDWLELKDLSKKTQKLLKADKKVKFYLGEDYLRALKEHEIILKSPGIPFNLIELEEARKRGVVITSQTEIFLENCPGKIIGITGTKGKSTTASLVYAILKEAGLKAHLVGNIGKPVLGSLLKAKEDDIYVYEMSSHQLVNIKKGPQVAVFLNVFPEHLDYYRNFKEYIQAKGNVARFQTKKDYLIFNGKDKIVKATAKKSKAKKIDFNSIKLGKIVNPKQIPLKGEFNLQNVKAALAVGKIFGLPNKVIARAVKNFKPLSHRLEFIGEYKGIKFYNDALSTIPETAMAAIEALGNDVQTIILGGFERNLSFKKLAEKVLESKIRTVILFPTTGQRIWEEIEKEAKKLPKHFLVDNMKEAVKISYQETKKGKICLLSTASPSFSIFKDYEEKGNLFKKYVKEIGSK